MYTLPDGLRDKTRIKKAYIIGGIQSVPNSVQASLAQVERVSGNNRSDTNARIIEKFYQAENINSIFVSKNGQKNPNELIDGLAVGAYAAKISSPILLADGRLSDSPIRVWDNKKIANVVQVGLGTNSMAVTELLTLKNGNHVNIDTKIVKNNTNQVDNSGIDSLEINNKTKFMEDEISTGKPEK